MSHATGEPASCEWLAVRRTRRDRRCQACGLTVEAGQRYAAHRLVFTDGGGMTVSRCGRCELTYQHLVWRSEWDAMPYPRLDCGEDYETTWEDDAPPELQAAVFATAEEASAMLAREGEDHG